MEILGWIVLVTWVVLMAVAFVGPLLSRLWRSTYASSWDDPPRPDARAGVREPRKPPPDSDAAGVAVPLP